MIQLPIDLQIDIWKKYYNVHVMDEFKQKTIYKVSPLLWMSPSDTLISLCNDVGAYQHRHTDLLELVEDHNICDFNDIYCLNCKAYKFPCLNCTEYVFDNQLPSGLFNY